MITWRMVLLAIYLMVVIGIFIMNSLCASDLRRFRDKKKKEGVRFKSLPRAEKAAAWIRLITSAVLPIWNLFILYAYIWQTERIMESAKQDLMKRAFKE